MERKTKKWRTEKLKNGYAHINSPESVESVWKKKRLWWEGFGEIQKRKVLSLE